MASILCFGDSITQGFVDLEGGWTQRLRRRLDQDASVPMGATTFPAHAVFNLGISGDAAEGLLARLEPELGPRRLGDQTIVVVAVGVNETAFDLQTGRGAHDPERFAATLAELVATARRHTDRVLLVGLLPCHEARMQPPPWSPDGAGSHANDRIAAFNQAVRRVAADHRVALVDCFDELLAATTPPCSTTGCTPTAPATSCWPTGSASGWPRGCERQPVVGQAVAFATGIASVLGTLFGGVIVDRIGGRRTAIVSDALSLVTVLALVVALVADYVPLWLIVVTQVLGVLFDGPGMVARDALVPRVAGEDHVPLVRATSLQETLQNTASSSARWPPGS